MQPRRRLTQRGDPKEHSDDRANRRRQNRNCSSPGATGKCAVHQGRGDQILPEVGYVGRDVESIIRDLVDVSVKMFRESAMEKVSHRALDAAEDRILDVLLPQARGETGGQDSSTRQIFRKKLREGELDEREVDIEVSQAAASVEIMAPPGMEE